MDYKFYINSGGSDIEIHPVNSGSLNLEWSMPSDEQFYRHILKGDLIIQNDSSNGYADFTNMRSIVGYKEVKLKIRGSHDSYSSVIWQGYLSTFDGDWDEDECQVIFKDVQPDDYYRLPLAYQNRKYNIHELTDRVPIKTVIVPEKEEAIIGGPLFAGTIPGPEETSQIWNDFGVGWLYIKFASSAETMWVWRRYRLTWQPSNSWYDGGDGFFYYSSYDDNYTLDYYQPNARGLLSLIKNIYDDIQGSVSSSIISEFFNNSTNPVSLDINRYKNLVLSSKGDYYPLISGYTTIDEVTFADIMEMLKDVFQLYWKTDSSGRLIIEHISWFDNGGSYSGSPTVGLDMTSSNNSKYIDSTKKYTYEKNMLPESEAWEFDESVGSDFIGKEIIYPQIGSNVMSDNGQEVHNVPITTDLPNITKTSDSLASASGLVLVAVGEEEQEYITDSFETFDDPVKPSAFTQGALIGNQHTLAVTADSEGRRGIRLKHINIQAGETIRINYLCSYPFNAPKIGLFYEGADSKSGSGIAISNIEEMSNGTGVIDLVAVATNSAPQSESNNSTIYIYNDDGDTSSYTVYMTIKRVYSVVDSEDGILSGETQVNGALATANLHNRFWKHHRPFFLGTMNGVVNTVFNSLVRIKKQMFFFKPMCAEYFTDPFDPYKLIKTQLGNGKVASTLLNLGSNSLDIALLHDEENKLKSDLSIGGIGAMIVENDNIVG